jgi:hypothetical protein
VALPLYCFIRGDTLGLVVLAPEGETVSALALRLARAAAPRVTMAGSLSVWHRGKPLAPELTLRDAGVAALDRVDLIAEGELG